MHSNSFMSALRPGTLVARRFRILELIGEGGFGAVYKAEEVGVGRHVALKLIHRPDGISQEDVEELKARFEREAQALGRLHSPFIVNLVELGMFGQRVYLAMEFVRGRPLAQLLAEEAPLKPLRACALTLQILQGLAEAHQAGVIHRDLKPDNVMVERLPLGGETIKLLDFGVARFQNAGRGDMKTQDGRVLGTPSYMAPEQGLGRVSPQSDLYGLGVILFEMLSGRLPFVGETALELMTRKLNTPPPIDYLYQLGLPPALVKVVAVALATEETDRYPDAMAMGEALHAALDETTGAPAASGFMESTGVFRAEDTTGTHMRGAVEVSAPGEAEEEPGRSGRLVIFGIAAMLLAAAAAAFLVFWLRRTPDGPTAPPAAATQVGDAPVVMDVTAAPGSDGLNPRDVALAQSLATARVADDAGRRADALAGYRRFLAEAPPQHPERAAVQARVDALSAP